MIFFLRKKTVRTFELEELLDFFSFSGLGSSRLSADGFSRNSTSRSITLSFEPELDKHSISANDFNHPVDLPSNLFSILRFD